MYGVIRVEFPLPRIKEKVIMFNNVNKINTHLQGPKETQRGCPKQTRASLYMRLYRALGST